MSLAKATALSLLRQISTSTARTASNAVVVSGFLLSVAIYFVCQFVGFVLLGWLSAFCLRRSVLLVWTLSRAGHAVTAIFDASCSPHKSPSKTFLGKEHVHLFPLLLIRAHPVSKAALSCAALIAISIVYIKSLNLAHLALEKLC